MLRFDYLRALFSDNNECMDGTNDCHKNATCTNTDGSFTCACDTGYGGNGVTCTGKQTKLVVAGFYLSCYCIHGIFLHV